MPKFLLFVILGFVVYLLLKRRSRQQAPSQQNPPQPSVQQMVVCAHCGVYVPESESLLSDGQRYCGEAHRKLGVSGANGSAGQR
jgi:uncharacterized protein